jgi:hypothetical protein
MLYPATRAEVWLPPGRSAAEVTGQQAWAYREPRPDPVVELVLGAGNVSPIAPRDLLYGLFVENRVVVLKCNPVNDYLAPHWQRAFRALVEAGLLRIVTGDAAAGAYLVSHPDVGHIHMTGPDKTFEAVVFGPGPDDAARKARGERRVKVPVTTEGGNVSPVIIVPGRWSSADLRYQAAHVATMLANNAGFNCNAARVLITAAAWPQRQASLDALEHALASLPPRRPYYPGAAELHAAFLQRHPDARRLGDGGEGTLCATLIVKPHRHAQTAAAINRAVRHLRDGSVAINLWAASAYALNVCSWGAYPRRTDNDIQSGRGTVANTFMLRDPEQSVLRAPFRHRPRPAWFTGHTNSEPTLRALAHLWANPSPATLIPTLVAALRP